MASLPVVDWITNLLPQLHVTLTWWYAGWISACMPMLPMFLSGVLYRINLNSASFQSLNAGPLFPGGMVWKIAVYQCANFLGFES